VEEKTEKYFANLLDATGWDAYITRRLDRRGWL
jgi:hypothetical protein